MLHARIGIHHHQWDVWRSCWLIFLGSKSSNQILVAYIGSFLGSTLFWKKHQSIFLYLYTVHNFDPKVQSYFRVIGLVLGD